MKVTVCDLIGNEATKYTEADREWLEAMKPEQLESMVPNEVKPVVEPMTNEAVVAKATELGMVEEPKGDGVVDALSTEDREFLEFGKSTQLARRKELSQHIVENANGIFTQEQLDEKKLPELEKLGMLVKAPEANYSGRPPAAPLDNAVTAEKVEPLKTATVNWTGKE